MLNKENKALHALLEAESDARQIRTHKNKVTAQNEKGAALFTSAADPFVFLQGTPQPERLEKLQHAYLNHYPVSVQLETPHAIWEVTLKNLPKATLLTARNISDTFQFQTWVQSEQRVLQESLDTLPVGFYITDTDGRIQYTNERLCGWLSRTKEELLHQSLNQLIKNELPVDENWMAEVFLKRPKSKPLSAFIFQNSFERNSETLFEGIVIATDIFPKKKGKTGSGLFFDKAPLGIFRIDAVDLIILEANPAFLHLTGLSAGVLKETPLMQLLDNESKETLPLKLSKLMMHAQKFEKCELSFALPTGEKKTVMAYIAPVETQVSKKEKDITSFLFYLTDLNEHKNLEMQMAHAQKMQAMGQLAGGVAHDFNNLLTAIIGFSDLLLQKHGMGDPSFADIMQIKHNANRASGLVGQLLAFSRKQPLKPQLIDISDAFSELSALLRRSIGPQIELIFDHTNDLGFVKVDPNQLTQVFLNLAVNARDAMPSGGQLTIQGHTEIIKKARSIGNDMMIPGHYVVISVADTGCGIQKENLSRIFEPFFSTKEGIAGSGTGLGLSTVYGIITQTDGYIQVESEVGVGTTFTLYLPRFDAPAKPFEKTMPAPLPSPRSGTIMLVEDEDAVRAFSARVLKNKGFTVLEFSNADEALKEIEKGTEPDLLLTDMMMPGMDGETLAQLAKERYPSLRVILMSGYSEDFARHGKDESKTFSFLAKPFSLTQLVQKVREVLFQKN